MAGLMFATYLLIAGMVCYAVAHETQGYFKYPRTVALLWFPIMATGLFLVPLAWIVFAGDCEHIERAFKKHFWTHT